MPKCPTHLKGEARIEWRRMVKLLSPLGLLTSIDGDQLALYCSAYARWADAEKHLAEDGVVVKSPNGYPIQNPYLSVSNKAADQMHRYLAKFGMNPADRARVNAEPEAQAISPKDRFFGGMRMSSPIDDFYIGADPPEENEKIA